LSRMRWRWWVIFCEVISLNFACVIHQSGWTLVLLMGFTWRSLWMKFRGSFFFLTSRWKLIYQVTQIQGFLVLCSRHYPLISAGKLNLRHHVLLVLTNLCIEINLNWFKIFLDIVL
jgi:hypothetical protein